MTATLRSTEPLTDHCPQCGKRLANLQIDDATVDLAVEILFGNTEFRPDWMKAKVRAAIEAVINLNSMWS